MRTHEYKNKFGEWVRVVPLYRIPGGANMIMCEEWDSGNEVVIHRDCLVVKEEEGKS